jgi:mRNA-degrading endonuclease RelE of RelBE toxin-antitoxin system
MASYDVVAKPAVAKDLRALPKADAARLLSAIERLAREPRSSRGVHYVRHRRDVYRRI